MTHTDLPIPLSCPCLRGNEKKYVLDCLESEWVSSSGRYVAEFEKAFASFTRTDDAVACVNGTAALHLCLILAGVQPGEEVIVPTLTFIAPINTVKYISADPVFMDCDDYLNMDVEKLSRFLAEECEFRKEKLFNKRSGKRIRAVIPVHIFGSMCEMEPLMALAEQYRLTVIEDATEALGSKITDGRFNGAHAGTIGEFGTCSFNGNKIITCGGGGMISAKQPESLAKARYLSTQAKNDELHYIHDELGYNYRLTALQAAMGLAQMEQVPNFVRTKQINYQWYREAVAEIPGLSILDTPAYAENNCWFYSLLIEHEEYGLKRDELMAKFAARQIQTRPIWQLNHQQRPYRQCQAYQIEKADYYFQRILNIPCSVGISENELKRVLEVMAEERKK